jgi:hypothetical protein
MIESETELVSLITHHLPEGRDMLDDERGLRDGRIAHIREMFCRTEPVPVGTP